MSLRAPLRVVLLQKQLFAQRSELLFQLLDLLRRGRVATASALGEQLVEAVEAKLYAVDALNQLHNHVRVVVREQPLQPLFFYVPP